MEKQVEEESKYLKDRLILSQSTRQTHNKDSFEISTLHRYQAFSISSASGLDLKSSHKQVARQMSSHSRLVDDKNAPALPSLFDLIRRKESHEQLTAALQQHYRDVPIAALREDPADGRYTLLHIACYFDDAAAAEILIDWVKQQQPDGLADWVNVLSQKKGEEFAPLHLAAFRGNLPLVRLLMASKAVPEVRTPQGLTVLHIAAQGDECAVLHYFVHEQRLDVLDRDFHGSTPMHWACFAGSENALQYLLAWAP